MGRTKGMGPIADLVLVKDYEAGPNAEKEPHVYFRIHMDVKIKDADFNKFDRMLKEGDFKTIYKELATAHREPEWERALALLHGALIPEDIHATAGV